MIERSTDVLSYAFLLFVGWVYIPYAFFKFTAEWYIDLGRRRDSTQLEEIISAFLPGVVLNLQAMFFFFLCTPYSLDYAVFASMFGRDRGDLADYIYDGSWDGCVGYLISLWIVSMVNGWWFGRAVQQVAGNKEEENGLVEAARAKKNRQLNLGWRCGWGIWYRFFHESVVPLLTWREQQPWVRLETTNDRRVYYGEFVGYEKTTDGRLDAVRLKNASRFYAEWVPEDYVEHDAIPMSEVGSIYINWSEVSEMSVTTKDRVDRYREQLKAKCKELANSKAAASPPAAAPLMISIRRLPPPEVMVPSAKPPVDNTVQPA